MESYDFTPAANFQRKSFHWITSQSKNDDYNNNNKKETNNFGRRVYSRSRYQIPKSNIQSWIENVEKSVFSDGTIGKVLSAERQLPSQPTFSRKTLAQMTLDQLRHHDEAQQEAEELLNDWVQKKLYEPNILNDNLDEFLERANGAKSPRRQSPDFSLSMDFDEDAAVDEVIQKMLQKKVVPVKVRGDLGLDSKAKQVDPRVKMELRRKQVRENRLRREREADKRRQEIQLKKEARLKAHQKIMEEDKMKEIKRRQEEYEVQKEMALIRKQMKEEKKRMEEKRKKEQQLADKASEESRSGIHHEKWAEVKETVDACRQKEEQRRQQEAKMEALKMRQKTLELQSLHRHFSSWYGLVLQQRLRVGKACALADWKLLMRCWNTWRSITSRNQIDKELQMHQQDMKDNQRKDKKASLHYSGHLLQKYFLAWELFVYGEKERRQLEESQRATKKKMQDLLDAALSRKLPPPENTVEKASDKPEVVTDSTRCEKSPTDAHFVVNGSKQNSMPTEHWKIRKSMIYMKPSRMAAMLGVDYPSAKNSQKSSSRSVSLTPLARNTIERQLQSQKILVKDQQKQLKEQRKMIEQLQSDHRCQQLKEQIKKQQEVFNCRPPGKKVTHPNPEKTETILSRHRQPFKKRHSISETNSFPLSSPRRSKTQTSDQRTTFVLRRSQSVDCINTKDQKILKNMEARAAERKRLKEEREIRKQQKEEEKLALLKAAEEQRLQEEEEERKEKIKTRQEQKRLEKQREAERQKKLSEMQLQNEKADDFRKYLLVKYRGILPWKEFVAINRDNHIRAVQHSTSTLLRKYMIAWSTHVQETNKSRNEMADTKYKQLIVVRLFNGWRNYKNYTTILEAKADRFYLGNLCVKFFKAWLSYSSEQTMACWEKEETAEKHYRRQLQRRMFCIWRTFPEIKKRELERQQRKEKMRQKVSMLLPDFE